MKPEIKIMWFSLTFKVESAEAQLRAIEATEKMANSANSKIVVIGSEKGAVPIMIQPDAQPAKPPSKP